MNTTTISILALLSIFMGEFFAIMAEILYTRGYKFPGMLLLITLGGILLLIGYGVGYKVIKNIWIIYVISITSILIIEPILISILTGESWTLGAKIGFALGVLGFLSTMFIK